MVYGIGPIGCSRRVINACTIYTGIVSLECSQACMDYGSSLLISVAGVVKRSCDFAVGGFALISLASW